jgi:transcriptional regulator with XRE-family HTH domain
MSNSAPDPIDVAVGARLRLRRKAMKVSQSALAEALDLTFQQVQKYERGTNRISASMLVKAARRLDCTVAYLVGEEDALPTETALFEQLMTPGAHELLEAYTRIPGQRSRRSVIELVRSLAEDKND